MSRSIKVEIVFGFKFHGYLSPKIESQIIASGLVTSPLVYTTEDDADSYIIGLEQLTLDSAGQVEIFKSEFTEDDKQQMKELILEKLTGLGFEVGEKKFALYVNTYYS